MMPPKPWTTREGALQMLGLTDPVEMNEIWAAGQAKLDELKRMLVAAESPAAQREYHHLVKVHMWACSFLANDTHKAAAAIEEVMAPPLSNEARARARLGVGPAAEFIEIRDAANAKLGELTVHLRHARSESRANELRALLREVFTAFALLTKTDEEERPSPPPPPPPPPPRPSLPPSPRAPAVLNEADARTRLGVGPDAGRDAIERAYRSLYTDAQLMMTQAPTRQLREIYERHLHEIAAARDVLLAVVASDASEWLPTNVPLPPKRPAPRRLRGGPNDGTPPS